MFTITRLFSLLLLICLSFNAIGQGSFHSEKGAQFPSKGEIRVLLVYAELVDLPSQIKEHIVDRSWKSGQLPNNPGHFFDARFTNANSLKGEVSKTFYDASLGNLIVTGDHLKKVLQVPYGRGKVLDALNQTIDPKAGFKKESIQTANGFKVGRGYSDFDQYGSPLVASKTPDGYIDVIVVVWRNRVCKNCSPGGSSSFSYKGANIKGMKGNTIIVNMYEPASNKAACGKTIVHELAHNLLGGNNWHTNCHNNTDITSFQSSGGFSLLDSGNCSLATGCNAFDRWRLGWYSKDAKAKGLEVVAQNSSKQIVNTDLKYGDPLPADGIFELRPFDDYGDAIRIQLPFLTSEKPTTENQYLWLINKSYKKDDRLKSNPNKIAGMALGNNMEKGVYIATQVGRDDKRIDYDNGAKVFSPNDPARYLKFTSNDSEDQNPYSAPNGYMIFHSSIGRFDFQSQIKGITAVEPLTINLEYPNPLNGYSTLMSPHFDYNKDGKIGGKEYKFIRKGLAFYPQDLAFNYRHSNTPLYGTNKAAFIPKTGRNIMSIASNPTTSPIITHRLSYTREPLIKPTEQDNKTSYLNGIKIEVIAYDSNTRLAKVKINWNHLVIDQNTRWCGNVKLMDARSDYGLSSNLIIESGKKLLLDQGYTPTQPVADKSFAYPFAPSTKLVIAKGSSLRIKSGAHLDLKNAAQLIVESGAELIVEKGAKITYDRTSKICLDRNARLNLQENKYDFLKRSFCN